MGGESSTMQETDAQRIARLQAQQAKADASWSGGDWMMGDKRQKDLQDEAKKAGIMTSADASEVAKRAPSPLAEVDPLDQFTKQVRARLTRSAVGGAAGRSIASLFGGF